MPFHIKNSLRSFIDTFLNFVYPPLCLSCNKLLEHGREHVCPDCWASIQLVGPALPLFVETRGKLVGSGTVDELAALYVFEKEGAFQKIAHSLKYSGVQALGLDLGRRLGQIVVEKGIHADMMIPVPLHRRKLRERGYNQAELIARGLSGAAGIPLLTDLLCRKKYTETQTALSLEDRQKNMEDAFEVIPAKAAELKGKTCIVVDDVITTGATIESCGRVLKNAGAAKVVAVSTALAE